MTRIGLITIGQSPRTDISPEITKLLPDGVDVAEAGALDAFDSPEEVERNVGPVEDDPIFVTLLRDGSSVTVDRRSVIELVQNRIDELAGDVSTIGILCTGHFPTFESDVPVLEPSNLLHAWASSIVQDGTIGIIMPKEEQLSQTYDKWSGFNVVAAAGSPYVEADEITPAAESIGTEADLIVMDCMGYTDSMKNTVRETTGTSTLLGRSVLGKTLTEVL